PYRADTPIAIAMKHVSEPPRAPREADPEVPEGISALVVKLLAKRPEDRYRDAAALVQDLQRVVDGLPPALPKVAGSNGKKGANGHVAAVVHTRGLGGVGNGKRRREKLLLPIVTLSAVMVLLGVVGWNVVWNWEDRLRETPEEVDQVASAVGIEPSDSTDPYSVFVHRATPENISANSTYLDNPLLNGNPNAVLYVTQNWNPGGREGGTYNDHPVGVWYDTNREKWAIFNQDRAAIPEGAAFNVLDSGGTTEAS
ncbi:MAG: hypothetical protein LC751_20860, partial [Actinobacteria bacterium]|nr:hypothetical protein [Actinomycetota bacterium]